ncbi:FtsX-like permease family protein [Balneolaceae bacterium YR4-1]|uniref:FtsX-like permease family protein n=1 Tax=Halalkalibaculum roseum TaxID=2709311 RepID=A0A6M1SZT5_9BACT|nr:ABC transporter permease [Halalkalibaculum roseum]NGP76057.1 FtsX-like permease family protein [Halalkalibaculum roseum]
MNIKETFSQAYDSLKANKLRSSLTLLALVVGVFSVIVSTTAVAVLDNFFQNTMSIMGGDVINISRTPSVQIGDGDRRSLRNRQRITFDTAEELQERLRLAKDISPDETFDFTKVIYGDEETEPTVRIVGSNEYYLDNNAYELRDGRNLNSEDIEYSRPFAILGHDIQEDLFQTEYPLGKNIRVSGQQYQVIGLLEEKGSIFGQSLDNIVIIPYTTALNIYGGNRNIDIQAKAPAMEYLEAAMDEITGVMRVIRKVAPGMENDFEIETNDSLAGTFDQFTFILYAVGFIIGGITLFGAGIGVMNIMLVSVTERTREIGIRKAVGATRKAIVSQFLMEAIFICQLGGIIGIALGILAGNGMAVWIETEPVIPIWAVTMGFFGMFVIGIVFGVYPAFKAAQLDPIESLRYE